MKNLTIEQLKEAISKQVTESQMSGVEYKQSWRREHGKDISAIANHPDILTGWLVVGVNDIGEAVGADQGWAHKTEMDVSTHIKQYLDPTWAVKNIIAFEVNGRHVVAIEITKPGDVVYWDSKAYKLIGSTSHEMKVDETLALSLTLPGADYSKATSNAQVDGSLILSFAQKLNEVAGDDFHVDLATSSPQDVLRKLNILNTNVANILFGEIPARYVHFNKDGDILDQKELKGTYRILIDTFIEEIHSWTRKEGTDVGPKSVSAPEELPYPPKALREILANAVAHALYQRDKGDIVVELHPDRITVRNNCSLESNAFVNKWLSRHHKTFHKHLMNTLRAIKITDEQGSGKIRIFKHMLEHGKREPIIDFENLGDYGRWSISLYNDEANIPLKNLYSRLLEIYGTPDKARVAQALLLWRGKSWAEIRSFLDENYKYLMEEVLKNKDCPVSIFDNQIFTKRWAQIALDGQVTKEFTEYEKNTYQRVLNNFSFSFDRNGYVSSEDAKAILGLSNTKQESGQIGKLFMEWKRKGIVEKIRNAQWRFLRNPEQR